MTVIFSLLVTGTDTGVGKTFVSAGLAAEFRRRGLPVGVMKPFATGAERVGGRLVSEDALLLKKAAGVDDDLDLINPVCLKPPLAPEVAARIECRTITPGTVWSAYRTLSRKHRPMVVEGVGGLLVPLFTRFTVADLAKKLRLPLLIVTRPALGTLNHTALTVEVARRAGLRILGLVINHTIRGRKGLAERTNPDALVRLTGVPILGELPYGGSPAVFRKIVDRLQS